MYATKPGLTLAFHGCDQSILSKILLGEEDLRRSENGYDWLGHGIYFWDNNLDRAFEYALFLKEHSNRSRRPISTPSALGAILNLGHCLDLLDYGSLSLLRSSYEVLEVYCKNVGLDLPRNYHSGLNKDLLRRELDCAVIETLHKTRIINQLPAFDSVRGVFWEGKELYPNAGFREKDHIQICIRNPNCIKGYFLPRKLEPAFNNV